MVKIYEYETGLYEYVDQEGNKRIGRWKQKYERDDYHWMGEVLNRRKVGVVDFIEEDDDDYVDGKPDKRRECPHCIQFGVHKKLSGRILKKGEEKPYDYDKWLQCVEGCGNIFPRHEIEKEKVLKADTEKHKTDNPFEVGEGIVMSVPSRTSKEGEK